ncbi:MAG: hypothetical protein ABSE86_22730, partial [Bryobacteraceae bacterium]
MSADAPERGFHERGCAGERVFGAVDPAIVMIAADDPLVRICCAGNSQNYVVERFDIEVEFQIQVHFGWAGPNVIGDRQSAAPGLRSDGTLQCREQRLGVAIRNGHHGNFGQGDSLAERKP